MQARSVRPAQSQPLRNRPSAADVSLTERPSRSLTGFVGGAPSALVPHQPKSPFSSVTASRTPDEMQRADPTRHDTSLDIVEVIPSAGTVELKPIALVLLGAAVAAAPRVSSFTFTKPCVKLGLLMEISDYSAFP